MTAAELDQIEAALGRPLPKAYRKLMTTCPPADLSRYLSTFYSTPDRLIRRNRGIAANPENFTVREKDGAGGYLPDRPWPADWIAVGDADTEWYSFVRPDAPGLWEWFHDGSYIRLEAKSLAAALTAAKKTIGPPPAREFVTHPVLGELEWLPEARSWWAKADPAAGRPVSVSLKPSSDDRDGVLALAVELLPRVLAAEPAMFAAALADGLAEASVETSGPPPSEAELRAGLTWDGVSLSAFHTGPPTFTYVYDTGNRFGANFLVVLADATLRYSHHVYGY